MKERNVKLRNGDDVQEKGTGHDLVPIGRLSVDGQIWFETVSVWKVEFSFIEIGFLEIVLCRNRLGLC
jgi:hypothetical protein